MHVVSSASQLFLEFFLETVFVPGNNSQSSCLSRTLLWVTPSETSVETEDVEKPPATKLNLMIIPQWWYAETKHETFANFAIHGMQFNNWTAHALDPKQGFEPWGRAACIGMASMQPSGSMRVCFREKNGCQSENSVRNIHQTHDATKPRIENIYIDAKTGHCKTDFL